MRRAIRPSDPCVMGPGDTAPRTPPFGVLSFSARAVVAAFTDVTGRLIMLKQTSSEYRGFRTAGIRLREEMMPHLARLTAGGARAMFHALHAFDTAPAGMLTEQGLLPRETAAAILRALREMEKEGVEETRSKGGGGVPSGGPDLFLRVG